MKLRKSVIIVAGGKGERMNAALPKQFLELNGLPILMHTVRKFHASDDAIQIVLVLPNSQIDFWEDLCRKHRFDTPHSVVAGDETRFHSVRNGLAALAGFSGLIAVHDGVRPMVSAETINRCFDEARRSGAAIPVIGITDSIREITENSSVSVDRSRYRFVQTPQVFRSELIKKSYEQPYSPLFTDDASVVESSGKSISLVEGNVENIKITTWMDLEIAKIILSKDRR